MSLRTAPKNKTAQKEPEEYFKALTRCWNEVQDLSHQLDDGTKRNLLRTRLREIESWINKTRSRLQESPNDEIQDHFDGLVDSINKEVPKIQLDLQQADEAYGTDVTATTPIGPGSGDRGNELNQALLPSQEETDLNILMTEATDAVQDMKYLNDLTHKVHDEIKDQQTTLIHIDEVIESAKIDMIEGNEELDVAEIHQKSSSKTLIYVIIALVVAVVVVTIIVFLARKK